MSVYFRALPSRIMTSVVLASRY